MAPAHGPSGFFRRPRPIKPKAGQESVWDYPRPPRVEPRSERVIVRLGSQVIVDTRDAVRVLETSHPPVYYLALDAFPAGALVLVEGTTFCEFKGEAHCEVNGEQVAFQEGDFYGGWITKQIVGPFKGGPGTAGW